MSDQYHPGDAHLIEETVDQLDLFIERVIPGDLGRIAKPPQVKRVSPIRYGGSLHYRNPVPPGAHPPMQKDERAPASEHLIMHNLVIDQYNAHSLDDPVMARSNR